MNNLTEKWTKDTSESFVLLPILFIFLIAFLKYIVDNMLVTSKQGHLFKDIHSKTRTHQKCANIKCECEITSHCYWSQLTVFRYIPITDAAIPAQYPLQKHSHVHKGAPDEHIICKVNLGETQCLLIGKWIRKPHNI